MEKVALITLHTPTATNYGGASALPYHLIKYRPQDVELQVWLFNHNGCTHKQISESENTLGVRIHLLDMPRQMLWLSRY